MEDMHHKITTQEAAEENLGGHEGPDPFVAGQLDL